jgi:hypothetical protein
MAKLITLALIAFLTACATEPPDETYTFVYSITGTATSASLTYACGETRGQIADVKVPDSMSFTTTMRRGDRIWLYHSAQNGGATGSITTTITVNGTVFRTNTSHGAYTIASASGTFEVK